MQSEEKSKAQEGVREPLDRQLKDSLLEAQNLRSELEVWGKVAVCFGGVVAGSWELFVGVA